MSNYNSNALRVGMLATVGLVVLQLIWHAWLAPPRAALLWPGIALAVLPLLPALWAARHSLRRGVLIGGIMSLFYFSHGVSEAWSGGAARWLSISEIGLTLIVIAALGWDVREARRAKQSKRGDASSSAGR